MFGYQLEELIDVSYSPEKKNIISFMAEVNYFLKENYQLTLSYHKLRIYHMVWCYGKMA